MLEITDELVEKCAAVAKEVGKCSHIDWSRLARALLTAAQQQGEAEPNRPLEVSIASGRLIISIGVDTLASAAERCLRFYDGERDRYTLTVTDKEKFATEVVRALQHEEEDGTTPLHVLLDDAFEAAVDDGCEGVALAACPPKTESEA